MVNAALSLGALVGVVLSAAFLYLEVGRYAAPQVPRSLFDERKVLFAYTAGLFVGIPLALPWLLFLTALANGGFVSAAIDLLLLVVGTEIAQWILLRSTYFGSDAAGAFYALALRAGIAGILILAVAAQYFGGATFAAAMIVLLLVTSIGLVTVEVAGSLLSLTGSPRRPGIRGSPVSGGVLSGLGIVLLGVGWVDQGALGIAAIALALLGAGFVYFRLRKPVLSKVRAADAPERPKESKPFGRTDR